MNLSSTHWQVCALVLAGGLLIPSTAAVVAQPEKDARIDRLIRELSSGDKETRLQAVAFLGWERSERAASALGKVLQNKDPETRRAAIDALTRSGPAGAKVLAEYLRQADVEWRLEVVAALGYTGYAPGLVPLRVAASDADSRVRVRAVAATGWIVERFILEADEKARDRAKTAAAVFKGRGKQALATIRAAVKDKSPAVRAMAALVLGRLAPPDAAETIKAMQTDPAADVRAAARWAIIRQRGGRVALASKTFIARLKRRAPKLDFPSVSVEMAIQFVREVAGVPIRVNWRALQKAGFSKNTMVSCVGLPVSAERLIDIVLFSAFGPGADWLAREDVIYISTPPILMHVLKRKTAAPVAKPDNNPKVGP